jgi:hypothetical protein
MYMHIYVCDHFKAISRSGGQNKKNSRHTGGVQRKVTQLKLSGGSSQLLLSHSSTPLSVLTITCHHNQLICCVLCAMRCTTAPLSYHVSN